MSQIETKLTYGTILYPLIQERTGVVMNDMRRQELNRYFADKDATELVATLPNLPTTHQVWQEIVHIVTVGETYFYRNKNHFNALRHHVLPVLIANRRKNHALFLRLWTAGCATGEEPYSLAMLLHELIPDIERWSIMILATDLNETFLDFARTGRYSKRSFRTETPNRIKQRWFTSPDDHIYDIDARIKRMITFAPLNLISDKYPSLTNGTANIDLVMCRNVTIYFNREQTANVAQGFFQTLSKDGWLLVGHSEPQSGVYDMFETRQFDGATLYRKSSAANKPMMPSQLAHAALPVRMQKAPREPIIIAPAAPPPDETAMQVEDSLSPEKLLKEAQKATDSEDWITALALLQRIEKHDMFNAPMYYLRGLINQQTNDPIQAIASFRQAIYCDPHFALAHYALGELYEQQGNSTQATAHFNRSLKALGRMEPDEIIIMTDDLSAEMFIGLIKYRLGQKEEK